MKKRLAVLFVLVLLLSSCTKSSVEDPIIAVPPSEEIEVVEDPLYTQLIVELEQQTLANELDWDTVFKVTHQYDTDKFNFILFSNEFHTIHELESFGIATEEGLSIFLLNETLESSVDGSITEEKNFYIVKGVGEESIKLPVEEGELAALEKAIVNYVDSKYMNNTEFTGPVYKELINLDNSNINDLIKQYLEEN